MADDTSAQKLPLAREVQRLKIAVALLTLAVVGLTVAALRPRIPAVLTVERINIVEPSGAARLIVSNSTRMPPPVIDGREYPRAVQPAGIIFCDAKGSEMGGIAITDGQLGRIGALAFDYPQFDAVGLITHVSPDGKDAVAGLQINGRPEPGASVAAAARSTHPRLVARNVNEMAEIILSDPAGRDRIRLRVDEHGEPAFEILDAQGEITFRAPPASPP